MIDKRSVKEFIMIVVGLAIVAAAVFFFMLPSHVSVGSASALGMIISNFVPLPVSVITLIMNIFLLIVGYFLIGTLGDFVITRMGKRKHIKSKDYLEKSEVR
jgi:uncharacterized membrane-anchored protein YitT (DUF2179 family)